MKKINPPGLVAILAIGLSFFLLLCSFLVSNFFQDHVININKKLIDLFSDEQVFQFYSKFKIYVLDPLSELIISNAKKFPEGTLQFVIFFYNIFL